MKESHGFRVQTFKPLYFDETLPNFIKWKHARKRERKRNTEQRPKSKQVKNPKEANHKEIKEP
jgi:hypothetical protein